MPDVKKGLQLCTVAPGTVVVRCDTGILEMREPDGTSVVIDLWNLTVTRTAILPDASCTITVEYGAPQ